MGWTMDDFALASELQAAEQSQALCDNNIDAMIYTVGHPSGSIQEATTACDSVLVDVVGETIDALVADNPSTARPRSPAACIAAMTRTSRPSASARPS
jgi:TRAP-type uncharacterized transport system substrate-binding protein